MKAEIKCDSLAIRIGSRDPGKAGSTSAKRSSGLLSAVHQLAGPSCALLFKTHFKRSWVLKTIAQVAAGIAISQERLTEATIGATQEVAVQYLIELHRGIGQRVGTEQEPRHAVKLVLLVGIRTILVAQESEKEYIRKKPATPVGE
ncbi:hypothetical protein I350_07512 [Cryptococcus amylolentus CBS 6273]|uniref:Uncharacterized protein n=1 Tax=Cryptococcus amylolentus CBS 6273 TaxID=1296118 RepID=A0A1E3JAK6_9TREE|nr:hypothetical protein I350_07512 [Cryptococcus amylolentus CBS 6273]